jgi:hypothetical protein
VNRLLVDSSRDGGTWWFPQSGPFEPAADHQGKRIADHVRSKMYIVTELPRPRTITPAILRGSHAVVRAVGFGAYAPSEIAAYQAYVQAGGKLLLLADHMTRAPRDALAESFGIVFAGVTRTRRPGLPIMGSYAPHDLTTGLAPLAYLGSAIVAFPPGAQILGRLSDSSYADLNNNGAQDGNEPSAPNVLGVLNYGRGRIVFCGDVNLFESMSPRLTSNLLTWFEDN